MAKKYSTGDSKEAAPNVPAQAVAPGAQVTPEQIKKMEEAKQKQLELLKKIKEKLDQIKKDLEPFTKDATKKYKDEVVGMVLMPPKKKGEPIDVLAIIKSEEKDMQKKFDEKKKIEKDLNELVKKSVKGHSVRTILLNELWEMCYKGKYDIVSLIALGMPLFDSGLLGALRVADMHRNMVLKKFEKYVVSYIIAGSFLYGRAKPTSDLDAFVIIDDTDVTRMTSQELRTKLRGIILGMASEAGFATGIKGKLHVQVWVLTDMWDSIKNANPIMLTVLRDGVPMYDRGLFMPWKLLLEKGKLAPTPEAVDSYVKSGSQVMKRVNLKLRDIAEMDLFYAVVTPSQGVLMMMGVPPPVHVETPGLLREHLVKPGLLEEEYVKIVEANIKLHKDFEHGKIKEISPKEVEQYIKNTDKFLKRFDKLVKQLEKIEAKKDINNLYEKSMEDVMAALKMAGVKPGTSPLKTFEKEVVKAKLAPARYFEVLSRIAELKEKQEGSRVELARLLFEQDRLAKDVFDIIRAQKGAFVERYKITVVYQDNKKKGDLWLLGKEAYLVKDVTSPQTSIYNYTIGSKGELTGEKKVSLKDLNEVVKKYTGAPTRFTDETLRSLRNVLGKDANLMIGA